MAAKGEFYVYRLFHQDTTLYIGKGSGSRLSKQKRHFGVDGEVVSYFRDEDDALREEVRLIALHEPLLNVHPGGNGCRVGTWSPAELPNGLTPDGLRHAAPHLARLLLAWLRDQRLGGILNIIGAYHDAHGFEKLSEAVSPHFRRLLFNDLAVQNNGV